MKRLLLVTIVFPPQGGGGTIRVAKYAKYLPRCGWKLSVVTARAPNGSSAPASFPDVRVYRAPRMDIAGAFVGGVALLRAAGRAISSLRRRGKAALSPEAGRTNGGGHRRRLAEYVFIPDDRISWVPLGLLAAVAAVLRDRPDAVYSTAPSPVTHLVGFVISRLFRLPWVVEFRDPWMRNPFRLPRPFAWMETLEGWLEKTVLRAATHVVVTSDEYGRDFLRCYPFLTPEIVTYIPNGFDPEDFEGVTPHQFDIFTIVHTGTFYEARSSVPFLEALALVFEKERSLRGRLQVVLVGQRDPLTDAAVARLALGDAVTRLGTVPHCTSIEYVKGADLLLLVPGPGDGTMPGKTYEYLAGGKPVLALAEEGVVRRFVEETKLGIAVDPHDVDAIAEALLAMHRGHDRWLSIMSGIDRDSVMKKFSRREIAARTAELLDNLTTRRSRGV